jgi:subtilisin family serine protease
MKILKIALTLSLLMALTRASVADGTVPGHVLVKPKPGVSISALAASYGARIEDQVPGTSVYSLTLPPRQSEAGFVSILAKDSRLIFAETDTYLINPEVKGDPVHLAFDFAAADAGFVTDWNAPLGVYSDLSPLRQVNLGLAQERTMGKGVTVAVLDTGLDLSHSLLQGHCQQGISILNPGFSAMELYDGTTNAAVGHGTMVAGIIARIAPDAQILPIRVLNGDGLGTAKDVAKGIMYALQSGARVANLSLTSSVRSKAIDDALDAAEQAGMSCIVAAGNTGTSETQYPSSRKEVIVVAAVDSNNLKASFSSYNRSVSVVAPGVGIRSTYLDSGYATWAGTSFAAPFVSGEAALIFALRPDFLSSDIKEAILSTALKIDSLNPLYKGSLGKGIIDIAATIQRL